MVNSHFIPQLILRHFCEDEKIQYYDLNSGNIESKSTKSVFSEKGYYPENIEKGLCHKIEVQFANILNNKILKENYNIALTSEDLLTIKKYLIITTLRVKDENMEHNLWYKTLKRDGFIFENDPFKDIFSGDFYENMNKILECQNKEELVRIANKGENMNLFNYVKDVVFSYNVFVRTNNSKEDLIITDRGWAAYMGPIGVRKMNALMQSGRIEDAMLLQMVSPQDYGIFPLSRNMAIITMSPAYKQHLKGSGTRIIYPPHAPTLSACLGFGSEDTIEPPTNKFLKSGAMVYQYKIKQLVKRDVIFLNSLLLDYANQFFGYANADKVRSSLKEKNIDI